MGGGGSGPSWLKGTRTVTGTIGSIESGKILIRALDADSGPNSNILCVVDDKTKIHVDKTPLTLADLKEDDPVAVRIKDTKDKGPYAVEIMPHPDVLARKQRGGTSVAPPPATELPKGPATDNAPGAPVRLEAKTLPPASPHDGPVVSRRSDTPGNVTGTAYPELPRGQSGITGTIVALKNDEATVELPTGSRRTVLVTSVTSIVRNDNHDKILERVEVGDRVAITGDSLDTGLYVARQILVNRSEEVAAAPAPPAPPPTSAPAHTPDTAVTLKSDPDTKSLTGTFTGRVESTSTDAMQVRTDDGRVRNVIVTPLTSIKKWNADTPLAGLKKGDEVKIVGDVLDDGGTLAREITVTKTAPSR